MDQNRNIASRAIRTVGALAVAIAAPVIAALIVFELAPAWIIPAFLLTLTIVFVISHYLGLTAGLLSIASSLIALKFLFVPPIFILAFNNLSDALSLLWFALASSLIVGLTQGRRKAAASDAAAAASSEDLAAALRGKLSAKSVQVEQVNRMLATLDVLIWEANGLPWEGDYSQFHFDFLSEAASRITGYPMQQLKHPEFLLSLIHPEDRQRVATAYLENITAGNHFEVEYRVVRADGQTIWLRDSVGVGDLGPGGRRVRCVSSDITATKKNELGLRLRAQAGELLESSLDPNETLERVLPAIVPDFADDCVLMLAGEDGELHIAKSAHVVQSNAARFEELRSHCAWDESRKRMFEAMFRGGKSMLFSEITDDVVADAWLDQREAALLRDIGARSAMVVALTSRRATIGSMLWISAEPLNSRRYDAVDLALAEQVAARIALAVENARLYQSSQQNVEARDKFLAVLGHELRNPLNAISNSVALAERRPSDEDRPRFRDIVGRQARHMSKLLDDLLDVARVTGGRITLQPRTIDLRRLAAECLEACRPEVDRRFHHVNLAIPDDPVAVEGDPNRLEQMLTNLLNNAINYTPPGGRIEVRVAKQGEQALLSVKDNGSGIPPDMIGRIFEPFTRLESSNVHGGGLGVGLALVRQLAQLHGGTVDVWSPGPGLGSEFTLRFPLSTVVPDAEAEAVAPAEQNSRRVLVVEDDLDNRETLRALLEAQGFQVVTAGDGPAGLQMARLSKPEVAIIDIGLPGLDGYEVARRLRQQERDHRPLLVALTGFGQPDDRARAISAGFDHHMVKPLDVERLMNLLSIVTPAAADGSASHRPT